MITKNNITRNSLKAIFEEKKYVWDDKLNLIGIRTNDNTPDKFNDYFVLVEKNAITGIFECTTDPGVYWLNNPSRINGTAILIPNQYLNSHVFGIHKDYPALVQFKPLKVWRDNNKDSILDYKGPTYSDVQGLNIHHGHKTWLSKILTIAKIKVDKYSAACQVLAFLDHFEILMKACKDSSYKNFTYTLLVENDFKLK